MFVGRDRRDDRFLEWKVRLFTVAAILALAGLYLDERWLTGTAIVVLTGAVLLRMAPGPEEESVDDDEYTGDAAAADRQAEGGADALS